MFISIWFLLGALSGLVWIYNTTDAFEKRELTFNDIRSYVFCLLLGGVSFLFMTIMVIITFFESRGDSVAFSWGSKPKKEKVIKGLDD